MIESESKISSYTWLILIIILSIFAMFSGGFDDDVVYYGLFIMAGFLFMLVFFDHQKIQVNTVIKIFLLFIMWSFFSLFWSISPVRTIIESIQLLSYALIYILVRRLSSDQLQKLIRVVFLVTGAIALLGLLEYTFVSGHRIHATFTNPNPFGIYMVMMFLLAISSAIRKNSKILFFLSVLFLSVVFLSGSRASMGAMGVSLIITYFGIKKTDIKKTIFKSVLIFITAFVLSQILLYLSVYIRENVFVDKSLLETITRSSSFVTSSLKGRLEFWRVAFDLFKNKPIIGYGQGTFFSAYYIEYGMNEWYSRFTHNHYLQIMAQLGLVGITIFLVFLLTSFRSIIFNAKQSSKPIYFWGMVAGMVAFLLHLGVDFTWNFPAVTALFFLFLGVTTKEDMKKPFLLNRIISIFGLVLIVLIIGWHSGSTKMYMRALDLEKTESVDVALKLTEKINKVYPISSFGWSYESELYFKKYKTTKTDSYLNESINAALIAINIAPYDATLYSKLAGLYSYIGDFENAEKYYYHSIKYSSYALEPSIYLSKMYLEMGENDKALSTLMFALEKASFAIKRAPEKTREATVDSVAIIRLTLANLYSEAGNQEKVQEQVDELIELKEEYPFLEKYFNKR